MYIRKIKAHAMTTKILILIVVSLFILSCSKKEENLAPLESPAMIEMRKQKAIWEARKIKSYTIEHTKLCYCIDRGRYKLVVKNNVIESAFNLNSNKFEDPNVINGLKTIDQLFTFIESTLKVNPYFSLIEYDKTGFPTRASFDINIQIADEEMEYFNEGLVENK